MLPEVSYLGHVISAEGLRKSDAKVKGIVDAPPPRTATELRTFLGLVNYYSQLLPDLATVLQPLYCTIGEEEEMEMGPEPARSIPECQESDEVTASSGTF